MHYVKDVLETVALVGAAVGFVIGTIVAHFVGRFRRRNAKA
jgi:hypothetical protein